MGVFRLHMVKELPAFLRPCRVQLFHLGTIAALEPERQAGRIALTVVFRVQHPLTVGTVLNTVQMQQPIEHLGSAAVLFGNLRGRHQRIGIAQLCFIAASTRRLLMQQTKQHIPIKRLRTIRRADCRMVQFAEFLCHVLCDAVVFHIPLDRAPAFILQPDTGHILVVAALDESILAHTRKPLAEIAANVHLVIQITRPQRRGQRVHTHEYDVHGVVLLVLIYSAAPPKFMPNLCGIIAVHGYRCIVECCQQVLLDVPDLSAVFF